MIKLQMDFKKVLLGYGGKPVLPPFDLVIGKGDFLGIVGPNGAGKTTVLKALLGIIRPISGYISTSGNIRFGYVPQQEILDELFPLSVQEIVTMARYPLRGIFGRLTVEDREAVENSLGRVEISSLSRRLYRDLSGGQKQRTLIARALATDPEVLVLDEPTNGMDILAESGIMRIIDDLNSHGMTIVMVSHMLSLIAQHAGTIMLINREVFIGPASDLLTGEMLSEAYGGVVKITTDPNHRQIVYVDSQKRIPENA